MNFTNTTWTNETTLLKAKSEFRKKWLGQWKQSGVFPTEICQEILNFCEPDTLFKWRRVCKLTNALVLKSDNVWRTLFYSRHWKLRHDLENGFVGVDPLDEDKSEWINVIPDDQVDWFGEYRRNHINSVAIRKAISDINTKLQKIVDEYGAAKKGVKQPAFFEPGLIDADIDKKAVKHRLTITNDLRELLKCCNGARFTMGNKHQIYDIKVPPSIFPSLNQVGHGMSYAHWEKIDFDGGWYSEDSYVSQGHDLRQPLAPPLDPEIPDKPEKSRMELLTASDMESDSGEYSTSDQAPSCSELEDEEEDQEYLDYLYEEERCDNGVFGAHEDMLAFGGAHIDDSDSADEQLYDANEGALFVTSRNSSVVDLITYPSIVDYVQEVSDHLDDPIAPFWLTFSDYDIMDLNQFEEVLDEHVDVEIGLKFLRWHWLVGRMLLDHITNSYLPPRSLKMLIAAAQDAAVKIFKRANELETSDELQPGAFTRAAQELFPSEAFPDWNAPAPKPVKPKRSTGSAKKKKK